MLTGGDKQPFAGTKIWDFSENLNRLLTTMISANAHERPEMKNVVKELAGIYHEETQKSQNLKLGAGLAIIAGLGLGAYFLLKELDS